MVEMLHLKLQLLADCFRAVRACVKEHQLPFLNLSAESLRVRLNRSERRSTVLLDGA